MFCPKCNDELVRINKELTCLRGQMGLSQHLEHRLTEYFILKISEPSEFKFSFLVGGKWFCPGCGVQMIEKDGFIRCPQCDLSLNKFIRPLVEQHPHLKENQKNEIDDNYF